MRIRKYLNGFYSRYIVLSIALLCATSLFFSAIICSVFRKLEEEKYIKTYDLALDSLNRTFQEINDNFSNMLSPIFDNYYPNSQYLYRELCNFLEDTEYQLSYEVSTSLMNIFSDICSENQHCIGLLLYSCESDTLYQYSPEIHTLSQISLNSSEKLNSSQFSNQIFCYQDLCKITDSPLVIQSPSYGIEGNIFYYTNDRLRVPGKIILLFSSNSLSSFASSYTLDPNAVFTLVDAKGSVIYSSSSEYKSIVLGNYTFPDTTLKNVRYNASKISIGSSSYYNAAIYNGRYEYLVQYLLPQDVIPSGITPYLFFILSVIICIIAVVLYLITFLSSARKVRSIQHGMNQIGENNLTYRLDLPKNEDEFYQIMSGFNHMCDELQKNVEQSYIHKIRQKESELYALQTSINPHFLYNTLELIRITFMQDKKANANQMILLLSRIYRSQLGNDTYITLYDALSQCEYLIMLYQYRFENFDYNLEIPSEFHKYVLPRNALQPLIENFFVHGIDTDRDDNFLEVSARWIERNGNKTICLTIFNTGTPPDSDTLASIRKRLGESVLDNHSAKGFALSNVNDSIRLSFGPVYGIEMEVPADGDGLYVHLIFPPRKLEDMSVSVF